jgi:hypothetical protein
MTQEDIIRMAREAGLHLATDVNWMPIINLAYAEKFAALVEEAATEAANARANTSWSLMCKKMVAAENEACAKLVDHILKEGGGTYGAAIRARGRA